MTTKQKPMITTWKTPEMIVGSENMSILRKHFIIYDTTEPGTYRDKRINNDIGEDREHIADILDKLHAHGFVPGEVGDNGRTTFVKGGRIVWRIITMSDMAHEFFHGNNPAHGPSLDELKKLPIPELQKMAREGWKKLMS